jgi:hypothetical protein
MSSQEVSPVSIFMERRYAPRARRTVA